MANRTSGLAYQTPSFDFTVVYSIEIAINCRLCFLNQKQNKPKKDGYLDLNQFYLCMRKEELIQSALRLIFCLL